MTCRAQTAIASAVAVGSSEAEQVDLAVVAAALELDSTWAAVLAVRAAGSTSSMADQAGLPVEALADTSSSEQAVRAAAGWPLIQICHFPGTGHVGAQLAASFSF